MADLPDALEHRVGPFPVVGWLAIVGAGVGLAVVIRRSELFGGAGEVAPVDAVDEGYGDPAAAGDLIGSTGRIVTVPVAPQNQYGPARPATNAAWRSAAVQWAIGAGEDAVAAESAAGHYLAGSQMTAAQGAVLRKMLAQFGPAPEGAPVPDIAPTSSTAPPGTTTPATPAARPPTAARPADINYTVKAADSWPAIAQHFYGSGTLAELFAMNRWVKASAVNGPTAQTIRAGGKVWLPGKLNSGKIRRYDR